MAIQSLLITSLTLFTLAVSQGIPATASLSALATVDGQYASSGFPLNTNAGFGTALKSSALITVQYGFGVVQNGALYTVAQVTSAPTIFVTPASASTFTSATKYSLILADASSLGDPDVQGNYRHFLANGLTGTSPAGANLTFVPTGGNIITNYATPGPLSGTGPHRYAWLLLTQPTTFTAPANLSTSVSPSHWSVASYISSTGLTLVAASFFTVQNGAPTGSVLATTAFSTSVAAATTSGASSSMITSIASSNTSSPASGSITAAPTSSSKPASAAALTALTSFVSVAAFLVGSILV